MPAELCPVCFGKGKWSEPLDPESTNAVPVSVVCHGCGGKGWVETSPPPLPLFQLWIEKGG